MTKGFFLYRDGMIYSESDEKGATIAILQNGDAEDGHLLAAAPKMLKALRAFDDLDGNMKKHLSGYEWGRAVIRLVDEAIKEATS